MSLLIDRKVNWNKANHTFPLHESRHFLRSPLKEVKISLISFCSMQLKETWNCILLLRSKYASWNKFAISWKLIFILRLVKTNKPFTFEIFLPSGAACTASAIVATRRTSKVSFRAIFGFSVGTCPRLECTFYRTTIAIILCLSSNRLFCGFLIMSNSCSMSHVSGKL